MQRAAADLQPLIDQVVWYDRPAVRWQAFKALLDAELDARVQQLRYEHHAQLTRTIAAHFERFNQEFKEVNIQMGRELYDAMVKEDNPFTEKMIKRQMEVWIEETDRLLRSMAREP